MTSKGRWIVRLATVWGRLDCPFAWYDFRVCGGEDQEGAGAGNRRLPARRAGKGECTQPQVLGRSGAYTYTAQNLPLRLVDAETSEPPGLGDTLNGAFPDKHGWIDDVRRKRFNGRFPHFFARLKAHNKDPLDRFHRYLADIRPIARLARTSMKLAGRPGCRGPRR